ncbi:SAM-dependent methyltransferase [Actinospica durhamensis]|uniref:SAM-dependent methyltransferase n=1 Tax=Actinospica durhamensis TaxID=1508375 RepID=A0A941EMG0_9ACTN|nr:SAM-dependent methyltransferase [Actinospica durhamensis]MBR7833811.1 SAM-dependent methyltransferase [Actinospica durhamensis]
MDDSAVDLQLDRPHSARMYDYYLGGTTNFPADREAVSRVVTAFPQALIAARANRGFMRRATAYLAEHGLRQFLDVGTGIPTQPNLHEVAQAIVPDARVVYVDNDPIVLAHAQALLISSGQGRTAYIEADLAQPEEILKTSVLHETLDLSQPVALSLNAVLHFVTDDAQAYRIVDTFTDALAPGSALVISHGTPDFSDTLESAAGVYRSVGTAVGIRDRARFTRFFERWELVEPGVTLTHRWHPDAATVASGITDSESSTYVAVARKLG